MNPDQRYSIDNVKGYIKTLSADDLLEFVKEIDDVLSTEVESRIKENIEAAEVIDKENNKLREAFSIPKKTKYVS